MMKNALLAFGLLVAMFANQSALAVTVTDLYRVNVIVDDRSDAQRRQGIQIAFQQLMVKISGDQEVLRNSLVIQASRNANRYMQGYSYKRVQVPNPNDHTLLIEQPMLEVWFSKPLIAPVLRQAKVPIWTANRPLLQLWIYKRQAIVKPEQDTWQDEYQRVFDDFGMPVIWAKPDENNENEIITYRDVMSGSYDKAKAIAKQSHANGALVGDISFVGGEWVFEGALLTSSVLSIQAKGDSPDNVIYQVASQIAKYFSKKYAVVTSTEEQAELIAVSDIQNFEDYAQLLAYLQKLAGVKRVDVLSVENGSLELGIVLNASWKQIERLINADKKLVLIDTQVDQAQPAPSTPVYRWAL